MLFLGHFELDGGGGPQIKNCQQTANPSVSQVVVFITSSLVSLKHLQRRRPRIKAINVQSIGNNRCRSFSMALPPKRISLQANTTALEYTTMRHMSYQKWTKLFPQHFRNKSFVLGVGASHSPGSSGTVGEHLPRSSSSRCEG